MQTHVSRLSRPFYLANVLGIAKLDGAVPPKESAVLQSIIKRIGATDQDLADAGRLMGSGKYKVHLPREQSERMANLQDMVMVALADGNVSPREATPIERAAKVMQFSQADMDMVVRRAELALKQMGMQNVLPSDPPPAPPPPAPPPAAPKRPPRATPPAAPAPPAKTMPLDTPRPLVKPAPKAIPLETSMPPSGSPGVAAAVEEAPAPPPMDAGSRPPAVPADGAHLSGRVQACVACRQASDAPAAYCFGVPDGELNVWGCRLAGMDWVPGAMWMALGHFHDDETFNLDKQAIADRLGVNLSGVLGCPHLHVPFTEKAFDMLPSRVSVRGHWRYHEAESGDTDAVTVHVTDYVHGHPVAKSKQVCGIEPDGTREAEKVIRRALRATGRQDVDLDDLRAPTLER